MPRTSGFTIVRNAEILAYPFLESVRSALPLCDEFVIALGDSTDRTEDLCGELERESKGKVRVIRTVWERESQSGGYQLKAQTDLAAAECRGDWCLYLQADEVLHQDDFPSIKRLMEKADCREDVDGLVFDYRHFYGSYKYEIRGRNWYRREVRLFKNHRRIEAFRDAQGFRRDGKRLVALHSGARVFHYGYVRTPDSLGTKATQMAQWWGTAQPASLDSELKRHVGLRRYRETHPSVMGERLKAPNPFDPAQCPRKWDVAEVKNAVTLAWETFFPFRIGEFRNYEITR
jgi:hypothetical protein